MVLAMSDGFYSILMSAAEGIWEIAVMSGMIGSGGDNPVHHPPRGLAPVMPARCLLQRQAIDPTKANIQMKGKVVHELTKRVALILTLQTHQQTARDE
ncbi:MAG: hypothetical protein FRX49_02713 [Trebouxia sp. A1-2]|nr:MAG: hypothetical protein FRX49_02713 [Trebouxia sp. A1-2]